MDAAHAALEARKAVMRSRMRNLRRELMRDRPAADWQAGDHVREMLEALLPGRATGVVSLYHASGSEMDPMPIAQALIETGWRLALPVCSGRDSPVDFYAWTPGDTLFADAVGILSPRPDTQILIPDLVLAPVLAFDAHGGRLGQGGGYYDRTIARLRRMYSRLPFAGLAYAAQEVEQTPMGEHDQRLNAILTEKGYRALG
ncbi:MAG: 5-formyltetrahydrofolate cyclo-ligase [Caulobacteraceae bacterium]|nr:5-formyltetrahydrofolate cyclo-ligase [Caulobacteraceae bacterium]